MGFIGCTFQKKCFFKASVFFLCSKNIRMLRTDLWKWVQQLKTERSPPRWAAASTNSWQSQTPHSLSHHNLGGRRQRRTQREENVIILFRATSLEQNDLKLTKDIFTFIWIMSCKFLPSALNICIPPYFPSKRTVLFKGLNARHMRTKTTSKQPKTHDIISILWTDFIGLKSFGWTIPPHLTLGAGFDRSGTVPWTLRCAWRTPLRTESHGWFGWHIAATARPEAKGKICPCYYKEIFMWK